MESRWAYPTIRLPSQGDVSGLSCWHATLASRPQKTSEAQEHHG